MRLLPLLACSVAAFVAQPALAAIIVSPTPNFVQPQENVLANNGLSGQTVTGTTNTTGTSVTFQSLNSELLFTQTNGQARFFTADGTLDAVAFYLTNPLLGFTQVEFNLFNASSNTTTVNLVFSDGSSGSYALGANGQNFFGAVATAGTIITRVAFDTNGSGVQDLRQVRLGGITSVAAVPEPATWAMMLVGFGMVAGTARYRRRKTIAVYA
ncbi:hypothetical protein ASG67_17270 [Sphingomonas sp. Leaf339]|uniref:PEPxxWA-CTERM sorting domain-containing protein n=1 Tax=Sphingomonas sp. Leaf339 TaxID=1736343 RepID=UPI0006FB17CF|nr:PEPxxWA-CTERM sorting domain-containing protein [Sphingomonas sp. Leaf339]KQU57504.1 hypothetical protein ASG67_17270 [Sphingomonas sp. Leaf339]